MEKTKNAILGVMIGLLLSVPINSFLGSPIRLDEQKSEEQIKREKYEADLGRYIDDLADKYECPNCPPNFRIIDSNNKYSYGCLQFQEATFVSEVARYGLLPEAEPAEVMNLIYDCDFQKKLAMLMFLNDPYAWMHWRTSVWRGLGLPPEA